MISEYLVQNLLNHTLRSTSYTTPPSVWLALLKAIPLYNTDTPANEVTVANGYGRKQITFGAPVDGSPFVLNSAAVTFGAPTGDWAAAAAPVVAVAIMDAETSGNWLFATPICAKIILNGDPAPKFEIGALKAMFDAFAGGAC